MKLITCSHCLEKGECPIVALCVWCDPWRMVQASGITANFCSESCMTQWFSDDDNHVNCYRNRKDEYRTEFSLREWLGENSTIAYFDKKSDSTSLESFKGE